MSCTRKNYKSKLKHKFCISGKYLSGIAIFVTEEFFLNDEMQLQTSPKIKTENILP